MVQARAARQFEAARVTHPADHVRLAPRATALVQRVMIVLRRTAAGRRSTAIAERQAAGARLHRPLTREEFAAAFGASPRELAAVAAFARKAGLTVLETNPARRIVVLEGRVDAVDAAFGVRLHEYLSPDGRHGSHEGAPRLPARLHAFVEAIIGLDERRVRVLHGAARHPPPAGDPAGTRPLTPGQVAALYRFPAGGAKGQVIGLFETRPPHDAAGYSLADLRATLRGFDRRLPVPTIVDVPVLGCRNHGDSDVETLLDIAVAAALAPEATLAVYITRPTVAGFVTALQLMVHPEAGQPAPTVISISYGWGADDTLLEPGGLGRQGFEQLGRLFEDAALLGITVVASTGDTGAMVDSPVQAQVPYPATHPLVLACGGTTLAGRRAGAWDEWVWNDRTGGQQARATGGGISAAFPVPGYQHAEPIPPRVHVGTRGRGIPDVAANASVNSGYRLSIKGVSSPTGGTSAAAPLVAALVARINANLGLAVGALHPLLYSRPPGVVHDITGERGPADNSFGGVRGYAAGVGWDACTGLGRLDGLALQRAIRAADAGGRGRAVGPRRSASSGP